VGTFPVVTLTVEDGSGNTASCEVTVDVRDCTPPSILNCPDDFVTTCNTVDGFNLAFVPLVDDACGTVFEISPGNPLPYGTTTVFVAVTDASGNSDECEFDVTVVPDAKEPLRVFSTPTLDGWVRQPDLIGGLPGTGNGKSGTIEVGDDTQRWMKRGILSFDTSEIPEGATVVSARIRLTRSSASGNPSALGALRLDMGVPLVGATAALLPGDYDDASAAHLDVASSFPLPGGNGFTTWAEISPAFLDGFDRNGQTQFRVRFDGPTNLGGADYIAFHSGEAGAAVRPELIVEFEGLPCFEAPVPPVPDPLVLVADVYASGALDGGVTESHWTSGVGGSATLGAPTVPVGDSSSRQQQMLVLSFDTSAIPADATIVSAELRLFNSSRIGNPSGLGALVADMRNPYESPLSYRYGQQDQAQAEDFQAFSHLAAVATISLPPVANQYTTAILDPRGRLALNKGGTTQMKLRFAAGDDGDAASDSASFATGDYGAGSPGRPRLRIQYQVPAAPP